MRRNSNKSNMVRVRCEIMGFVRIFWKEQHPRGVLAKTIISGEIVSAMLAQLCSDDSIQILPKKQFSIFLSQIRLQKQHSSLMYCLTICKAWVRSQLRWAWNWLKLKVTSSNVLRIIIHWLSARRDVGLTQGSLTPKEHSIYRALKHSFHQHKLDLNFE